VCVCVCVCVCRVRACYVKLNADDFYLQVFKEIPSIRNDKTITIESADSIDIEFISILVGANGPGILDCLTQSSTGIASS